MKKQGELKSREGKSNGKSNWILIILAVILIVLAIWAYFAVSSITGDAVKAAKGNSSRNMNMDCRELATAGDIYGGQNAVYYCDRKNDSCKAGFESLSSALNCSRCCVAILNPDQKCISKGGVCSVGCPQRKLFSCRYKSTGESCGLGKGSCWINKTRTTG